MLPRRWFLLAILFVLPAFAGTFQLHTFTTNPSPTGVVTGDFNHDGKIDLAMTVCGDQQCVLPGSVQVLFGHGDGTFTLSPPYVAGASGTTADTLASGDFNGDGTPDVVVVNNAINRFGNVSVLLADGSGGFLPFVSYPVIGSTPVWVVTGDFNNDHKVDIAVSVTTTDSVSILLGNGDGTFQPATSFAVEDAPQGITAGDVNGDGNLDIVAANECGLDPGCRLGTVSVLLGNGDGTFQSEKGFFAGIFPLAVAIADFDGDGKKDVVVALPCGTDQSCASNGNVGILLGNGDGTLKPIVDYPATSTDTARLAVGDFNGDHFPDVVAINANTTVLTQFLAKGDGTLLPGTDFSTPNIPIAAVAGDFNRDRASDLAVADEFGSEVSVFLNSGGTQVTLASTPNPSHAHQAVTLTATVAATLSGYGTPTGSVTFVSGAKTLGTAPLVAGVAKITRSNLPVGMHKIQANYSGDGQYNSNVSRPITQTVQP